MKALAVVNIGNFLSQNARESMQAAAVRWGADYVEISTRRLGASYPSTEKATVPQRLCGYDIVACFDADTVISEAAPSIFDELGGASIAAVKDMQAQCEPFRQANTDRHNQLMAEVRLRYPGTELDVDRVY